MDIVEIEREIEKLENDTSIDDAIHQYRSKQLPGWILYVGVAIIALAIAAAIRYAALERRVDYTRDLSLAAAVVLVAMALFTVRSQIPPIVAFGAIAALAAGAGLSPK